MNKKIQFTTEYLNAFIPLSHLYPKEKCFHALYLNFPYYAVKAGVLFNKDVTIINHIVELREIYNSLDEKIGLEYTVLAIEDLYYTINKEKDLINLMLKNCCPNDIFIEKVGFLE